MCGIAGYINYGNNKNFDVNKFTFASELFSKLEIRGEHASGYSFINSENVITLNKKPFKSSLYVNTPEWQYIENKKVKSLLLHTRFLTQGSAEKNDNNHPFSSSDGRFIFVHNGILNDWEIKKRFSLKSDEIIETDSYVFMLLLEKFLKENPDMRTEDVVVKTAAEMQGNYAIMMFDNKEQKYYTFRNNSRPIFKFVLENELWFCSTEEILTSAFKSAFCPDKKIKIIGIETPIHEVTIYDINNMDNVEHIKYTTTYYKPDYVQHKQKTYKHYSTPLLTSSSNSWLDNMSTKSPDTRCKCADCEGVGFIEDETDQIWSCPTCKGEGYINYEEEETECLFCMGSGKIKESTGYGEIIENCPECDGTGKVSIFDENIQLNFYNDVDELNAKLTKNE